MPVYIKDVVALLQTEPQRAWQKHEILKALTLQVTDAEAIHIYRREHQDKIDPDTDKIDQTQTPLSEQIRQGRKAKVERALNECVRSGYVTREGKPGAFGNYRLVQQQNAGVVPAGTVKFKQKGKPSEFGFGHEDMLAYISKLARPVTAAEVYEHFLPVINTDVAIARWAEYNQALTHPLTDVPKETQVKIVVIRFIVREFDYLSKKKIGKTEKPDLSQTTFTPAVPRNRNTRGKKN